MLMYSYIKFDFFLKSNFAVENWWKASEDDKKQSPSTWEQETATKTETDTSKMTLEQQKKVEELRKKMDSIRAGTSIVWQRETILREKLLAEGDPQDNEYKELAKEIERLQNELNNYWAESSQIKQELAQLLWEVQKEIKWLSNREIELLQNIDNEKFLSIPKEKRLQYVTKNCVEASEISNGNMKEIEFTFTYNGKYNQELYFKTTLWQVLPKEVNEVTSWWIVFRRKGLWWEFFSDSNERLIIWEWSKVEIWSLRTTEQLTQIQTENQKKVEEYLKNNPNANSEIVTESINRWIEPKFAWIVFWDLVKNISKDQISQKLEDAFTEFDRYRGAYEISDTITNWKYDDKLVIGLLVQFTQNWKEKAKEYWISEQSIKVAETEWEVNMWLSADAIQNSDSLPWWRYSKGDVLANNPAFSKKLDEVCASIWANRTDLIKVMIAESWMNPRAVNKNSWATGLIQFMPATARWLWTTVWHLRAMSAVEQLTYVEKYFKQSSGWRSLGTIESLYQAVFYPLSLSKPDSFIFGSEKSMSYASKVARQNPAISKFSPNWYIDGPCFSRYVHDHVSNFSV